MGQRYTLPLLPVFSKFFAERGRSDVLLWDVLPVEKGDAFDLRLIRKRDDRRHGVFLMTKGTLLIDDARSRSMMVWFDTAPPIIRVDIASTDGRLHLYHMYDYGSGISSQTDSTGMLLADTPPTRTYHCHDFGDESEFDDLVFSLTRVDLS